MKATLKNYRQSPRKVRLVATLVKGKPVEKALVMLAHTPKRATTAIVKLISSAIANAEKNYKVDRDELIIESITVDKGITLKRAMPRARGMSSPIHKHTSIVSVVLGSKAK